MTGPEHLAEHLFHPELPVLEKMIRPLLVYGFLILALRLAGKRELAQINTFDLVVLLTLSNTVQNAIIGSDNSLAGGLIGAVTLLAANMFVNWFLYRHPLLTRWVEGTPTVLIREGRLLQERLDQECLTREELAEAARRQGFSSLEEVERATLEAGGSITFVARQPTAETRRYEALMKQLHQLTSEVAHLRRAGMPAGTPEKPENRLPDI